MAFRDVLKSYNIQKLEGTQVFQTLDKKLKEDKWYKPMLDHLEQSSRINRVYIVTGCSTIFLSTLLYHFGIQLICGAVGFLYPGYQTIECLEKFGVEQGKRWLTYWLVFATFNFFDIFFFFLHWVPGYWIMKCLFFLWCYSPIPTNGSVIIYNFLIRPLFQRNQEVIDDAINHMRMSVQPFYSAAEPIADIMSGHKHD